MNQISNTIRVNLGDRARDRVTGITGIVTCRTEFLFGCVRVAITKENELDKDNKPIELYVDEAGVEIIERGVVNPSENLPIGGPERTDGKIKRVDPVR